MLVEKIVRHSFPANAGSRLEIDSDKGFIRVGQGGGDEIRVEIRMTARAARAEEAECLLERVKIEHSHDADQTSILTRVGRAEETGGWFWRRRRRGRIDLTLSVLIPCPQNLRLETQAGGIQVEHVRGEIRAATGAGAIWIEEVEGDVLAKTGSGSIAVRRAEGRVVARTASGDIALEQVADAVEVSAGAGQVSAEIVGQPRSNSRIETSSGNVVVKLAETIGLDLHVTTLAGGVVAKLPSFQHRSGLHSSVHATVSGGGPRLTVHTSAGQVHFRELSPA